MSDQVQKFNYLDEHLPYMLATLRYNFKKINQQLHFRDWNAYFESFAVNARNLTQFLDNADAGNFKARDFISGFRVRKGDIQGPLAKLRDQVFHLGKSRPREAEQKFDLTCAMVLNDWIEAGMQEFVDALSVADRKEWNEQKADPNFDGLLSFASGPTGPSKAPLASSSGVQTTTSTSSSVHFRITGLGGDPG